MISEITFPQFRKYLHGQSFFKVISADKFEEVKKEPTGYKLYHFEAKILPDRNFIQDMLFDLSNHWVKIEESEYEEAKNRASS